MHHQAATYPAAFVRRMHAIYVVFMGPKPAPYPGTFNRHFDSPKHRSRESPINL